MMCAFREHNPDPSGTQRSALRAFFLLGRQRRVTLRATAFLLFQRRGCRQAPRGPPRAPRAPGNALQNVSTVSYPDRIVSRDHPVVFDVELLRDLHVRTLLPHDLVAQTSKMIPVMMSPPADRWIPVSRQATLRFPSPAPGCRPGSPPTCAAAGACRSSA